MTKPPPVCSTLVGSITPAGDVFITFLVTSNGRVAGTQTGTGKWTTFQSEPAFLMQTGTSSFSHWAFMVQASEYSPLAGTAGQTPHSFLANCPPAPAFV